MDDDRLLSELELELATRARELERGRVELAAAQERLHLENERRAEMQLRIDRLGAQVRQLSGTVATLRNELDSTYASASWRVTRPLRRLRRSNRPAARSASGGEPRQGPPGEGTFVRFGTSDIDVFTQVFVRREYDAVPQDIDPALIIDCGANVGYASMFLLERFPRAEVIAIEPDPANADAAARNLAGYGTRASVIQAAVWPRRHDLKLVRGAFRDGREWTTQVAETLAGETPDVLAVELATLIGTRTVDLLKIDIERAELPLFSAPCPWLAKVRNIVIELHDTACEDAFHAALASYDYDEVGIGELTICTNLRPQQVDD